MLVGWLVFIVNRAFDVMSEPIQSIGHLVNFKGLAFIPKLTFGKLT